MMDMSAKNLNPDETSLHDGDDVKPKLMDQAIDQAAGQTLPRLPRKNTDYDNLPNVDDGETKNPSGYAFLQEQPHGAYSADDLQMAAMSTDTPQSEQQKLLQQQEHQIQQLAALSADTPQSVQQKLQQRIQQLQQQDQQIQLNQQQIESFIAQQQDEAKKGQYEDAARNYQQHLRKESTASRRKNTEPDSYNSPPTPLILPLSPGGLNEFNNEVPEEEVVPPPERAQSTQMIKLVETRTQDTQVEAFQNQVTSQFQALSQQLSTVSSQQLLLSDQIHQTGRTLSQQMQYNQQKTAVKIQLDAGRAATINVKCKNYKLQKHQKDIETHMDPDSELLDQFFVAGIIDPDERKVIEGDSEILGKRKRILQLLDRDDVGMSSDVKYRKEVDSLKECNVTGNENNPSTIHLDAGRALATTDLKTERMVQMVKDQELNADPEGPENEVGSPQEQDVDKKIAAQSCSEVISISSAMSAFLKHAECKKQLLLEFKIQGVIVFSIETTNTDSEDKIEVSAADKMNLEKAKEMLNTAIASKTIHTYQLYRDVFTSDRWQRLCDKIHTDHQGEVLVIVDDVTSEIKIVGFTNILPGVVETVERFITREQFDKKKGSPFFHHGDVTTQKWTEEEKKHLTETSAMRVLYIGEYMAGKTSLVRTILSGDSYLSHVDDRTVIAEHNHWTPDSNKNSTFSLVDLGGHQSYLSSGHFFHCNSRNNIATLCHDVTSKDYQKSFIWLSSVLTRSPKCHIAIALTKSDLLSEQEGKSRLKTFQDKLLVFLKREIKTLEGSVWMAESSNSSKLPSFIELRDRYQWIVDHIADITALVSSEKGYEHTVTKLTNMYVELSEKPENKVLMPKHFHSFFSISGNVGKKIEEDEVVMPQIQQEEPDHKILSEENEVTVTTPPETEANSAHSVEEQDHLPVVEPETGQKALPYMTLDTAKEVYNKVRSQHNLPESTDLKIDTQRCLGYLHDHGLMIYYGVDELENIVFNNINSFVSILRSVFHHEVEEFLNFSQVPVKYRFQYYNNEESLFTDEVELLHSQGLMSIQLLNILLHRSNCLIEPQAVIQLLDLLEIGFSFIPESMDTKYTFIPFFIEKKQPSDDIRQQIENMGNCDSQSLSIHSQIRGNLSLNFWHYLVVRFCKKLHHDNMQQREIWSNGFLASVERHNIRLMLLYNGDDVIDMKVRGIVSSTAGHEMMWQFMRLLNSEINGLMRDWWPGLVTAKVVSCMHCVIRGAEKCHEYRLEEVLDDKNCVKDTCCCRYEPSKSLPSALVMPLPLAAEAASAHVSALMKYLQEAFAEVKCDNTQAACVEDSRLQHLEFQQQILSQGQAVAQYVAGQLQQVKCNQTQLSNQITQERQQLAFHISNERQQLGDEIRTERQQLSVQLNVDKQQLSHQVASQGQVLSDQMFLQGKELSRNIAMDAGDASQVNLTYSHPVLQNNKALLERHLNVTTELLHRLVTLTGISGDQHKKIEAQTGEGGKQKLLLYFLDLSLMEDPGLIQCFIEALQDIGGGTNAVLAASLANSCTGDKS